MSENTDNHLSARAEEFFQKAKETADRDNFDYAITMYLEGLRCAPDDVKNGHVPLHELAFYRQAKGGKKPSMVERVRHLRGKDPLEQMINAEYLFAKDPDCLQYAEAMLKAAVAGGYKETIMWVADMVFQANNASDKPSFQRYMLLKDAYMAIDQTDRALSACQHAVRLKPEDGALAEEFKNLTAELAVTKGKYDQEGDFRKSIKNRKAQEELQSQQSVVKTEGYRLSALEQARKAYSQEPNLPKNIFNLAEALAETGQEKEQDEAIKLLEEAYKKKSDFTYKDKASKIQIDMLKQNIKKAKAALESNPNNADAKSVLSKLSSELNKVELEHCRLCVENYPTDLRAKYEFGIRLIQNKQYDEAIPFFQQAQKEPRYKISALDKIGISFFMKGWYSDAVDVFKHAIELYEMTDDNTAKELRYNLARSYEEQGNGQSALELYRKIAQLDFAYKDVRQRVDNLRDKPEQSASR